MVGQMPRQEEDGTWSCLDRGEVMEAVGLRSIEDCALKRRNTVASWVTTRPLFDMCREAGRRRGSPQNKVFWWEQPMDLGVDADAGPVP